jgi:hypothetical protein
MRRPCPSRRRVAAGASSPSLAGAACGLGADGKDCENQNSRAHEVTTSSWEGEPLAFATREARARKYASSMPLRPTRAQSPDNRVAAVPENLPEIKYDRPRIIVLDLPDVATLLQGKGYHALQGTLGQPLLVPRQAGYVPLKPEPVLPHYAEQEVVVANLASPEPLLASPDATAMPPTGVKALWFLAASGILDPRPLVISQLREQSDRILRHGGVFILFVDQVTEPLVVYAFHDYGGLDNTQPLGSSNWRLLAELEWFEIVADAGTDMRLHENRAAEKLGISKYLTSGSFTCRFAPPASKADRWLPLAVSKYGHTIAGILTPQDGGIVVLLPQVNDAPELVRELLDSVLPSVAPKLFPDAANTAWPTRDEYELHDVISLKREIDSVDAARREEIANLEAAIAAAREEQGYLHVLLTGQDAPLVEAVITALHTLGFNDVRNVDADAEASGDTGPRREDIQILSDREPILGEVKGISGTPKEANALQVHKYIAPRQRAWDRTDLRGLSIMNHQRHLPPLERDNGSVFQPDVLTTADEQALTLLTTFDLFRLVRGFVVNGWSHEDVADLFYRSGRLVPTPLHYHLIGKIDHYWDGPGAIAFDLINEPLAVGDTVAYKLPVDFLEETVESLQIASEDVEKAMPGDRVGLKTILTKARARDGVCVYVVKRQQGG